jgi:hypothetical protein
MFNASEVQLCAWYFLIKIVPVLHMCGAPERLAAVRALSLCYHNNNGSESTVVESIEQIEIEHQVVEPKISIL